MLKFTCPKCGCNTLNIFEHEIIAITEVKEITDDEEFFYKPLEVMEGETEGYGCAQCEFTIRGKNENNLTETSDVSEWIKENCPQEEEETKECKNYCPKCGSGKGFPIQWHQKEGGDDSMWQNATCQCGQEFSEVYLYAHTEFRHCR